MLLRNLPGLGVAGVFPALPCEEREELWLARGVVVGLGERGLLYPREEWERADVPDATDELLLPFPPTSV